MSAVAARSSYPFILTPDTGRVGNIAGFCAALRLEESRYHADLRRSVVQRKESE
jgi:hypothetical protein